MTKSLLTFAIVSTLFAGQAYASTDTETRINKLEALDSITNINEQNLLTYETVDLFKQKFMQNREGKVNITVELQEAYQRATGALDLMIKNKAKCTNPALFDQSCHTLREGAQVKVAAYLRIAPPPAAARPETAKGALPPKPSKEALEAARAAKSQEPLQIEMPQTPHEQRVAKSKALVAQLKGAKPLSPDEKQRLKTLMETQRARKAGAR